jgi:type I restriction enzyme, S subunit
MTAQDLIDAFETMADAPNGVDRLKELVLQLAVRGRLVPQDPEDEPVAILIEQVVGNKEWRLHERPSRGKRDPNIEGLAGVHSVPSGWTEVRLEAILQLINGRAYKKNELLDNGTPIIRIQNLNGGDNWFYSDLQLPVHQYCDDGDLLFAWSASFGPYIWQGVRSIYHYHIWKIHLSSAVDKQYMFYLLKQITVAVRSQSHGLAMLHMTKAKMERWPILLPPLAEQHRIVAKIDELMALLDHLEVARDSRDGTRSSLRDAALAALQDAEDAKAVESAWSCIAANMDDLFTDPADVAPLRQTILQLAVRGRLVPQDSANEHANILLDKVASQKTHLVKTKAIRKPKAIDALGEDDLPFALPFGWEWSRLNDLVYALSDGPHFSPKYVAEATGVPFLSARNVTIKGYQPVDMKYVSRSDHEEFCRRIRPEPGDVLYTKGGTTGVAMVNDLEFEFSVWVHVAVLKVAKEYLDPHYVALALNSPHCYEQSQHYTHGTGNRDLGLTRMIKITVPIPPREEQERIVMKVKRLMGYCDELEDRLAKVYSIESAFAARASSSLVS